MNPSLNGTESRGVPGGRAGRGEGPGPESPTGRAGESPAGLERAHGGPGTDQRIRKPLQGRRDKGLRAVGFMGLLGGS
jgi:hypothetical protein